LRWNEQEQRDELFISLTHGSNGNGARIPLGTFVLEDGRVERMWEGRLVQRGKREG
jgi:hypothetical protein